VLAIISIATFQIFFISLPCASISIILALISRGDGPLLPRAKAALICASAAAVLTTSVTAVSVYTVMHDPALRAQVEQIYDYYTNPEEVSPEEGESARSGEELLKDILSGRYRESQKNSSSSGESPSGSLSDEFPAEGDSLSAQRGGQVI